MTRRAYVLLLAAVALIGSGQDACADDVRRNEIDVPMRDGVRLKTLKFEPSDRREAAPVVLIRTAYNRESFAGPAKLFASAGYVAVVQDSRGRYGSEGVFPFYFGEGQDGFDTVDWINRQPWCDGRVAMAGPSWMGSVQWLAASHGAELTIAAPTACATDFYRNKYHGGAYRLFMARFGLGPELFGPPGELMNSPKWPKWYLHLPLAELDRAIGHKMPIQTSMLLHHRRDVFSRAADASRDFDRFNFPALHLVGYYDFFCRETVNSFQKMRRLAPSEFARQNQRFVIGPWTHATGRRKAGELDFGPNAAVDMWTETLHWFDRHLKKKPQIVLAPVRYFVMGPNTWHESTDWPPAESKPRPLYLHSTGSAGASEVDGRLNFGKPKNDEPADRFVADPDNPVPAIPAQGATYADSGGPHDQKLAQQRDDVLVYSMKIDKPLRLAGPIRAQLFVSADTLDADWVVHLIDRHPSGFCQPIATGIQRATFRDSETELTPLEPGKVYRLTIDMGHSGAEIASGHTLQVQIAGSFFPRFDRNANTGEGPTGAASRRSNEYVFHDSQRPSHVILPLLPVSR